MPSDQIILAFDTSAAHCAAALLINGTLTATAVEPMTKGQAERLMPLLQELLAANNLTFEDITKIGVGVGPGNFTGIRISVAAARGLALGLGVPAVGVSTLEASVYQMDRPILAIVTGPRDQVYSQVFDDTPQAAQFGPCPNVEFAIAPQIEAQDLVTNIALIAQSKSTSERPAPMYIKSADAAPASDAPPVII